MSIEAMKLALEVIRMMGAPSPLHFSKDEIIKWQECNAKLDKAIEQAPQSEARGLSQKQEPVAWITEKISGPTKGYMTVTFNKDTGWKDARSIPLYEHPPQRQWVGLSDREKSNLWLESRAAIPRFHTYASLVEAKLREKNT